MLPILVESALRSLALGIVVALSLKLLRVRNPHIQFTVWSLTLFASLAMPLLSQLMTVATPLPAIARVAPVDSVAVASATLIDWQSAALHVYLSVVVVLLVRQLSGIVRGWRICRRAVPIQETWARETWASDMNIRASNEIRAPGTFCATILLPEDYLEWSEARLRAVLAHECTHVRNRDFHLQALARIHQAVFWFNPFAWWLTRKLALIGEELSDDAAIGAIDDRLGYAEMLVEFGRRSARFPAAIAMARPSMVAARIERVLAERLLLQRLSLTRQALVAAALLPAVILAAACSGGDDSNASRAVNSPQETNADAESATAANVTKPHSNSAYPLSHPKYPSKSRESRQQGTVVLSLHVLEDGSVDDVKIHKSSGFPRLDYSAANEAFAWRLDPATVDGRPTADWGKFAVTFKLDD